MGSKWPAPTAGWRHARCAPSVPRRPPGGSRWRTLGPLLNAQPDRDDAHSSDLVARGLLRHFGIPADEAARICSLDLPDLDPVDAVVM
jgi:hypothetical protein